MSIRLARRYPAFHHPTIAFRCSGTHMNQFANSIRSVILPHGVIVNQISNLKSIPSDAKVLDGAPAATYNHHSLAGHRSTRTCVVHYPKAYPKYPKPV